MAEQLNGLQSVMDGKAPVMYSSTLLIGACTLLHGKGPHKTASYHIKSHIGLDL